jgi:hypothetical protein
MASLLYSDRMQGEDLEWNHQIEQLLLKIGGSNFWKTCDPIKNMLKYFYQFCFAEN